MDILSFTIRLDELFAEKNAQNEDDVWKFAELLQELVGCAAEDYICEELGG